MGKKKSKQKGLTPKEIIELAIQAMTAIAALIAALKS